MPFWKARIGILSPSVFEIPSDWSTILPQGFTLVATGLNVQAHTPEEFNRAIDALESTLSVFVAEEVDAIVIGGITLATQRGYRSELEVISALSNRLARPVTSGMQAGVQALRHLKIRKIVIATAYKDSINQAVKRYYQEGGLDVVGIHGHDVSTPVEQVQLPEGTSARMGLKLFKEHPDADAVLLQGRWPSAAEAEPLEVEIGRPVITTVTASLWWLLKTLAIKEPIHGYGRLLRQEDS